MNYCRPTIQEIVIDKSDVIHIVGQISLNDIFILYNYAFVINYIICFSTCKCRQTSLNDILFYITMYL